MEPEKLFIQRFSELINNSNYTLEEIGHTIGIKSKSTIAKYLSGDITNIKRSQIVKLANLFNVSPAWLAGFSNKKYETFEIKTKNTNSLNSQISKEYGENAIKLLKNYNQLNNEGKKRVDAFAKDLQKVGEYTCSETDINIKEA